MGWQLLGDCVRRIKGTGYSLQCAALTHMGNRRKNNEDNFFIGEMLTAREQASMSQSGRKCIKRSLVTDGGQNRIFAVSDGMGGHENGEVASCMAMEALSRFAASNQAKPTVKQRDKFAYIEAFQDMIRQTNRKILGSSVNGSEDAGMGATLSGLIVFADETVTFNIGDSSVFLFEKNTVCKLTRDDNEAARFGEEGREMAGRKGRRLTKYLGLPESEGMLTAAISHPIPIRQGQIFLISSDGLTDCLWGKEIEKILADSSDNMGRAADKLIEGALGAKNGGNDNITVVLLKIDYT